MPWLIPAERALLQRTLQPQGLLLQVICSTGLVRDALGAVPGLQPAANLVGESLDRILPPDLAERLIGDAAAAQILSWAPEAARPGWTLSARAAAGGLLTILVEPAQSRTLGPASLIGEAARLALIAEPDAFGDALAR